MENEKINNGRKKTLELRRAEESGRIVAIRLVTNKTIIGILENYNETHLFVREFKEDRFIKDIPRSIIERFVILIKGGKYGR